MQCSLHRRQYHTDQTCIRSCHFTPEQVYGQEKADKDEVFVCAVCDCGEAKWLRVGI